MSRRDRGFARAVKDGGIMAMGREVGRDGMDIPDNARDEDCLSGRIIASRAANCE